MFTQLLRKFGTKLPWKSDVFHQNGLLPLNLQSVLEGVYQNQWWSWQVEGLLPKGLPRLVLFFKALHGCLNFFKDIFLELFNSFVRFLFLMCHPMTL